MKRLPGAMPICRGAIVIAMAGALLVPSGASARWSPAQWLSPPDQEARVPVLAVNDRGDALAAWTGPNESIMVAERFAGGLFGLPHQIGVGSLPKVALNNSGEGAVAWTHGPNASALEVAQRPVGGSFREPQIIASPGREIADGTQAFDVKISDNGDAVAMWFDHPKGHPDSGSRIVASWRGDDKVFGAPQPVTPTVGPEGFALVMDGNGRATVAWTGRRPDGDIHLWFAFVADGRRAGGFGLARQVSDDNGCIQKVFSGGVQQMAGNKRGDTVVAWREGSFAGFDDTARCPNYSGYVAAYRSAGGNFGPPQRLSPQDVSQFPGFQPAANGVALAVDEEGNALADWYDVEHAVRYRGASNGIWGAPQRVAPYMPGPVRESGSVGMDHTGRQVFLWHGSAGAWGPVSLVGVRRQANGKADPPETLSMPDTQNIDARMGFDKVGGGIVIWSSTGKIGGTAGYDAGHGVAVTFYEDTPPRISALSLVQDLGSQLLPPLALDKKQSARAVRFKLSERGRVTVTLKKATSCKRKHGRLACHYKDVTSATVAAHKGKNTVGLDKTWLAQLGSAKRARVRVRARDGIGQKSRPKQVTFRP